jgi:tRNA pseudouridine55 synthase
MAFREVSHQSGGVLLLDKPAGITSQAAVTRIKRLLACSKAGHTGTLDPMATGLLPVCVGEATKFAHFLLATAKTYLATVKLGITTSTGDMEGCVMRTAPVAIDRSTIAAVLHRFTGEILQTPPMHSAVKHAGRPLYRYAREGTTIERAPRVVQVHWIDCIGLRADELDLKLKCSKGTYVRVLAEQIGHALGCGACLSALRRTEVGELSLDGAVSLQELEQMEPIQRSGRLLPVDLLVAGLQRIDLDAMQARTIMSGRCIQGREQLPDGTIVRVYGPGDIYLGVAEIRWPRGLIPRRLLSTAAVRMGGFAGAASTVV